jgi:membrane-bound serine protease (ClpP class)
MCGFGLLIAGPALAVMSGQGASAAESGTSMAPVDVVEVSGLVDNIVADSITNALVRSQNNGSQAVILQLNSKGAVIGRERMAELLTHISDSKIPVAIWVGPSGSRAYGLPAQMLAVADVTAMAPGARIGRTGTMLSVDGKQLSFGAADDMLHANTLGFLEAREQKVLKFSTDDRGVPVLRNMLYALDGVSVRGATLDTVSDVLDDAGQVTREATTVRFFKLGLVPRLLHTVASPPSAYLLTTIGIALLIFEFFTAGIGIGAIVGATCLILGCMGTGALPMSGIGVGIFIAAFIAFAVDVQVGIPRFWTGAGLVLYSIASFTMFRSVDGHSMRPSWFTLLVCITGVALTFIVGMPSMVRTRFATPTVGRENLIGTTGTAVGDINPEGIVLVDGAQWRARTNRATPLAHNAAMRVVAIDGITLEVEPLEGAAKDYREARSH